MLRKCTTAFLLLVVIHLSIINSPAAGSGDVVDFTSKSSIKIYYCYSCGYHKLFLDVSNIIQNQFPEIQINGHYHDPPLMYYLLCKFITIAKFALILILLTNTPIFRYLGMAEPLWYRSIADNKLYSVFMVYFLSNLVESQLMSTGAFEIFLDDIPIWSKLETGHVPSPQELIKIIKNNLQFYKTDFKIE